MGRILHQGSKMPSSCPASSGKSVSTIRASHPKEGRCARHERCGGMRWQLTVRRTSARVADGEVVWSWRPDAGVKPVAMLGHRAGDGGKKSPVTGESAK